MRPPASKQSAIRWIAAIAALLAVGAMWVELAPAKLGGSTNYAVIDGVSMEPHLHHGDLVLLHPASDYRVGDVVGYHNLMLGRLVLHRIVARLGDRYVFKGDNNNFLDAYHPTQNELVGKLWFHVTRVGDALAWLHQPHHAAIAGGILALILAGGGAGAHRHRRHRRKAISSRRPATVTANPMVARRLASAAAIGTAAFGLVSVVAFTHPKTATIAAPGAYTQQGAYSYSADAQRGTVYPSGRISTGDTVFVRLANLVRPSFDYRFVSALPHSVHGTARLQATLQSSTGWTKTLPSPRIKFRGDHVQLAGELDLASLERQTQQYLKLTGVPNDSFTVVVTPSVEVSGQVGSKPINDSFAPTPMSFLLDAYSLRLEQATLATQTPGTPAADPLHPSAPGVLARIEPAHVKLLLAKLRVSAARRLGLAGLAGSAILALSALLLLARRRDDDLTRIQRRDGDLLVPLSSPPAEPAGGYIEVANFDSLAHLARSYERVILHHHHGDAHSFYIDDDGSVYRHRLRAEAA